MLALAARVVPRVVPGEGWQSGSGGALRLILADGTVLSMEVGDALGCPARPLPHAAQVAKFVDCLGRAARPLDPTAASALGARVLALDTCADVGALFA